MSPVGDAREQARNLFVLRRFDDARDAAVRVLSADASDAGMLCLLAEIELAEDNIELARDHAVTAVAASPSPSSYLMLASVERRSGDFAAAVAACEHGLNIDPSDVRLHVTSSLAWSGPWLDTRAQSFPRARESAAQHAAEAARIALDLDPQHVLSYYAAAVAALVRNDPFDAATLLEQGLDLDPEWAEGHLLMSAIRGRQGMVKLASRHLAIAGRLAPSDDAPVKQLREIAGRRRWRKQRSAQSIWWMAPEARAILEADERLGDLR